MFCPQCGANVGDSDAFCRSCGARLALASTTTEHPQKPHLDRTFDRTKWFVIILVCAGVIIFGAILLPDKNADDPAVAYCCTAQDDNAQPASDPQTPTRADTQTPTAPDIQMPTATPQAPVQSEQLPTAQEQPSYKIGDSFAVGYWSYECNRAFWTPFLGDPLSIERANGAFLVIDITVRNDDTSASVLPPFRLVDQQGRTYDESAEAMIGQGFFSALESLNPGVSKRSRVAFDVPPDRQYVLLVSGGIESGKDVTVLMPAHSEEEQPAVGPN